MDGTILCAPDDTITAGHLVRFSKHFGLQGAAIFVERGLVDDPVFKNATVEVALIIKSQSIRTEAYPARGPIYRNQVWIY